VASTLKLSRNGAACRVFTFTLVGFMVRLDDFASKPQNG
jgi:hypothetical protein